MSKKIVIAIAALVLAGFCFVAGVAVGWFVRGSKPLTITANGTDGNAALTWNTNDHRREAFIQYLDGKSISLSGPAAAATEASAKHTIKKSEVKAVEFPSSMAKGIDEPWRPTINLILDINSDRYFVRVVSPYHEIERTFAFLGLEVLEVAKQ